MAALEFYNDPGVERKLATTSAFKSKATGTQEFFPKEDPTEMVFTYPQVFERQMRGELAKPIANTQFPHFT